MFERLKHINTKQLKDISKVWKDDIYIIINGEYYIFDLYSDDTFENVTSVYSGGGIWIFCGKLKSGEYFLTDNDNACVQLLDSSAENMDESLYAEWQEKHLLRYLEGSERRNFLLALVKHLGEDHNERGITNNELHQFKTKAEVIV